MFLLCLKGGQKGRRYFSFPISAHRVACSVTPGSLTLSLANLFYRTVFGDSNLHESPAHVQSSLWCVETCPRSGAERQRVLSHAIDAGQSRTERPKRGSTGMQFTIRPLRKSVASIMDRPAVPANIN